MSINKCAFSIVLASDILIISFLLILAQLTYIALLWAVFIMDKWIKFYNLHALMFLLCQKIYTYDSLSGRLYFLGCCHVASSMWELMKNVVGLNKDCVKLSTRMQL